MPSSSSVKRTVLPHDMEILMVFDINLKIAGNDTVRTPKCALDGLCDVCAFFTQSALSGTYIRDSIERFSEKKVRTTSDGIVDQVLVYWHYSSVKHLKTSARSDPGCPLCRLLCCWERELDDGSQILLCSPPYIQHGGRFPKPITDEWSHFRVCTIKSLESMYSKPGFEFLLAADLKRCIETAHRRVWKFPARDALGPQSLAQVHKWHKTCSRHHVWCQRRILPLPKRLLDVGFSLHEQPHQLRLTNSTDIQQDHKVSYVALSYCWGGWDGLVTKKENLDRMLNNIEEQNLPSVIKDAILFCRSYGMRYLWIDSLCICQDDADDWQEAASEMGSIYGGSEFTLSALSSSKATQGFLKEDLTCREPVSIGSAYLSYGIWGERNLLWVRTSPMPVRREILDSPLSRRAWAFQERLLAPAVLHFGSDQLIWECDNDHLQSETGEVYRDEATCLRISDVSGVGTISRPRPVWDCIVEEYSGRELTYTKDRLPAIAGLARSLQDRSGHEGMYVAGLWDYDLCTQLLWHCADDLKQTSLLRIAPNESVPTWSWARRSVQVVCPSISDRTERTVYPNFAPYPKTPLQSMSDDVSDQVVIKFGGTVQRVSDIALSINSQKERLPDGRVRYHNLPGNSYSSWHFDQEPLPKAEYYCVRLLERENTLESESDNDSEIHYLLIRKAESSEIPQPLKQAIVASGNGADKKTPNLWQHLWVRAGTLELHAMSEECFGYPCAEVACQNNTPFLGTGRMMWIHLI